MGKWLARVVVMFLGAVMAMSLINVPAAYPGDGEPELPSLEECLAALTPAEPGDGTAPDGTDEQVTGPLEGLTQECLEILGSLLGILQPQPQPQPPTPQPAPPPPTSTSFGDIGSLPADTVVAQPRFTG